MAGRRDAYARALRMKARRAGGFAPPANLESCGVYQTVNLRDDALEEYGYPAGTVLLVRTDTFVPLGRLAWMVCHASPACASEGAEGEHTVIAPLALDGEGRLRAASLSGDLYPCRIKRVVGLVLGPLSPAETSGRTFTVEAYSRTNPGEYLGRITVEPGPVKGGDVAAVRDENGRVEFGKVTRADGRGVSLRCVESGEPLGSFAVSQVLGKVVKVSYARDGARAKLEALRKRLARLDGPEDEAARFRLLCEIYDLEHAQPDASNEWPEYIDDRRAT